jgi:hypothetical protein
MSEETNSFHGFLAMRSGSSSSCRIVQVNVVFHYHGLLIRRSSNVPVF